MSVDLDSWQGQHNKQQPEQQGQILRLQAESRRLIGALLRPHKRGLWLVLGLLLLQNAAVLAGPWLIQLGIDNAIPDLAAGSSTYLFTLSVVFFIVVVGEALATRSFLVRSAAIGQDALRELRQRIFIHVQKLDLGYLQKTSSGQVISRMTNDVKSISNLVQDGLDELVIAGLNVVSIAVIMAVLDWRLALLTALSYPALFFLARWFSGASSRAWRAARDRYALLVVHFVESVRGVRAVQAFRREERNAEIMTALNKRHRRANARTQEVSAIFVPGVQLIGALATFGVFVAGGWLFTNNAIELGTLTAFLLYLRRFFDPVEQVSAFYDTLKSATTALEKIAALLAVTPVVREPASPVALGAVTGAQASTSTLDELEREHRAVAGAGALRFDDVTFGYRDGTTVLGPLNLNIPAGQTVAIVGPTGAGKTTLARLIARFADPTTGVVSLGGVNLREVADAELRRAVTLVTQESIMFAGTVADNIGFARPDASRQDIIEAAHAVGADDMLAALSDGYDTDVGARGARLSAGQRQLIAFARAYLADPAVLILDEATASLDIPTERRVQAGLGNLLAERTTLIIAHRLSTVQIADRVLVIHDGHIVEDGPPAELAQGDGPYAALHAGWLATTH
ncbi:MAG: ABC transporter ATP-binding protein [Corynebacteriales bacterium]|nr:ABC transporter ATP-binding protein [Mycobacteriales bacterium]